MPRFLTIHHAPGVSLDEFQKNIPEVLRGTYAKFVHSYVNLAQGTIVNVYEGESKDAVIEELERIGFPFDEVAEIQFDASADALQKMAQGRS